MDIVVFGAGGRAGRQAVAEAHRRGHQVTAVVRDPAGHSDLTDVRAVAGDVTEAVSIEHALPGMTPPSAPPWTCPCRRTTSSPRRPTP